MHTAPIPSTSVRGYTPVRTRLEKWRLRLPLLPALVFVLGVTQIPFIITLYYSTQRWNMVSPRPPRFVWFKNFVDAVGDPTFLKALVNTALMAGASVVASIVVGGLLAMALNREFHGRAIARTLAITPFFVMPVAAALFWKTGIYDPSFGILGWLSDSLGIGRMNWASEYPKLTIIIITTWQWSSFALLILLAGMQSFPTEVNEAATIDGAGKFTFFRRLLLPHLRPFIELSALLTTIYVLESFAAIALLTNGGPAYASTNLSYYVYLEAFHAYELGKASAFGMMTLLIAIGLTIPILRIVSGIFKEGGRA